MPVLESRVHRAASSSVATNPWDAHRDFALQAQAALKRSYAAGVEQASLAAIMRREDALRRWRGLAEGDLT